MIKAFRSNLHRFSREESGTSTIEFVLVFPMIFTIFIATFESRLLHLALCHAGSWP